MPEATHWFERDGEMICEAYYKTSILWSQTMIQNDTDRMPRLEDFEPRAHAMRVRGGIANRPGCMEDGYSEVQQQKSRHWACIGLEDGSVAPDDAPKTISAQTR